MIFILQKNSFLFLLYKEYSKDIWTTMSFKNDYSWAFSINKFIAEREAQAPSLP